MVFVSHRLDEVVEIAERVTVMRDGRKVGTWPVAEVNQRRIAHLMTGLDIDHAIVARDMTAAEPLLKVEKLSRRGEFADIGFTLRRGEVLGIVGLLGSGRTELALTLFGMHRAEGGTIKLEGQPLRLRSNRDAVRAGIAYVSEDRLGLGVILPQSIGDNIILAVMKGMAGRFGLPGRSRRALAASWVKRLAIKVAAIDRPVQTLSGGNQQRIVLAKWLATRAKGADPRFADRRRRHQEQAGNLRGRGRPGAGRCWRHPDLGRSIRSLRDMRPGAPHACRARSSGRTCRASVSEHEMEERIYA